MAQTRTATQSKTRKMVQLAMLVAIEAIICLTPLGSIPIGPIVATLSHIPVIVAAIVLGYREGSIIGFEFGLLSFLVMTFNPGTSAVTAFVFTPFSAFAPEGLSNRWLSLIICFVPRILIGVIAGLLFAFLDKKLKNTYISAGISALVATIAHTCMVLFGIYLFFGRAYAEACGMEYKLLAVAIFNVILTNGIAEAIIAVVVASGITVPLLKFTKSR